MTDDHKRRIDDHRPAIALKWEDANTPARVPFARPNQWTILLTSSNHGLVGALGHTFPHATGDHVRVNVCDEAIVASLRERVLQLEAAAASAQPAARDVRAAALEEAATLATRLTAVPRDVLGPATELMKARARAGEKVAAAIRALIPAATPEAIAAIQTPAADHNSEAPNA